MRHMHEFEIAHGQSWPLGARLSGAEHFVDREPHIAVDGKPGSRE